MKMKELAVLELLGGELSPHYLSSSLALKQLYSLHVLSPLKNGMGIEKLFYINADPPLYFFANSSTGH